MEHFDSRNSGHSSSTLSSSQKLGACVSRPLLFIAPPTVLFTSSGVTTSDGHLHIIGGSDNHVYCSHTISNSGSSRSIDIRSLFTSDSFDLPPALPSSFGVGIEASPAVGKLKDGLDRIYVASTDGNLYSLVVRDGEDCGSIRPEFVLSFLDPLESAPRLFPDVNPERIITSTTGAGTDTNGALHCVDANTLSLLWTRQAQCCGDDTIYSLKGVAPAIDPLGKGTDHAVIFAFSYHILAIDLYTGNDITSLTLPNHSGPRRFVGSPTFARDGSSIFIAAATSGSTGGDGWLFKVNTAGDGVDNKMTLKVAATHSLNTCSDSLNEMSEAVGRKKVVMRQWINNRRNTQLQLGQGGRPSSVNLNDDELDFTTSSPTLTQDGSVLVSSQFSSTSGGLFRYPTGGGTGSPCEWVLNNVQGILLNGSSSLISIGTLRAAAAVDSTGLIYVTAVDSVSGTPLLLVLDKNGDLQLSVPILDSTNMINEPPPSRPLLIDDGAGGSRIIVGLGSGPAFLSPGVSCPSNSISTQCSGSGSCNCKTGMCLCFDGFVGNDCSSVASPSPFPSPSSIAPPPSTVVPDAISNSSPNTTSSPGEIAGITLGIALLIGSTFAVIRKRLFDQNVTSNITRRAEQQRLLSRSNPQSEASMSSRLSMLKVSSSTTSVSAIVTINGT